MKTLRFGTTITLLIAFGTSTAGAQSPVPLPRDFMCLTSNSLPSQTDALSIDVDPARHPRTADGFAYIVHVPEAFQATWRYGRQECRNDRLTFVERDGYQLVMFNHDTGDMILPPTPPGPFSIRPVSPPDPGSFLWRRSGASVRQLEYRLVASDGSSPFPTDSISIALEYSPLPSQNPLPWLNLVSAPAARWKLDSVTPAVTLLNRSRLPYNVNVDFTVTDLSVPVTVARASGTATVAAMTDLVPARLAGPAFQGTWPWFDHATLRPTNTRRTFRTAVVARYDDPFGSPSVALAATSDTVIAVSAEKLAALAVAASHQDAAISEGVVGGVAGITGIILGVFTAGVAAGGAAAFAAGLAVIAGIDTTLAQGFAQNAADPPTPDPTFMTSTVIERDMKFEATAAKVTSAPLRRYFTSANDISRIYAAVSTAQGRLLGARLKNSAAGITVQRRSLHELSSRLATDLKAIDAALPLADQYLAALAANVEPSTMFDVMQRSPITATTVPGIALDVMAAANQRLAKDPQNRKLVYAGARSLRSSAAALHALVPLMQKTIANTINS